MNDPNAGKPPPDPASPLPPAWTKPPEPWPDAAAPRAAKSGWKIALTIALWLVGGVFIVLALLLGTCFLMLATHH
jgi:hypothetical protein